MSVGKALSVLRNSTSWLILRWQWPPIILRTQKPTTLIISLIPLYLVAKQILSRHILHKLFADCFLLNSLIPVLNLRSLRNFSNLCRALWMKNLLWISLLNLIIHLLYFILDLFLLDRNFWWWIYLSFEVILEISIWGAFYILLLLIISMGQSLSD